MCLLAVVLYLVSPCSVFLAPRSLQPQTRTTRGRGTVSASLLTDFRVLSVGMTLRPGLLRHRLIGSLEFSCMPLLLATTLRHSSPRYVG